MIRFPIPVLVACLAPTAAAADDLNIESGLEWFPVAGEVGEEQLMVQNGTVSPRLLQISCGCLAAPPLPIQFPESSGLELSLGPGSPQVGVGSGPREMHQRLTGRDNRAVEAEKRRQCQPTDPEARPVRCELEESSASQGEKTTVGNL